MLQSTGLQRVGPNLGTEQQQQYINIYFLVLTGPVSLGAMQQSGDFYYDKEEGKDRSWVTTRKKDL